MKSFAISICLILTIALLFFVQTSESSEPDNILQSPVFQSPGPELFSLTQQPDKSFETRAAYASGELIVKFKPETGLNAKTETTARHQISISKQLLLSGYSLVTVPLDRDLAMIANTLRQDPSIELVEFNQIAYATFLPDDPFYRYQWHFPQIQMPQAWDLTNGAGVIVAVVDTGVAYEDYDIYLRAPDLANTLFVPGYDFTGLDSHPNDDHGHGTHVAGTIAQSTNNSTGVAGIAYGAKIMPVKVLNSMGSGTYTDVADGIVWAADNGAKVINLSLGGIGASTVLEDAVNYAYQKGAVVVAAAGNYNGPICYPAACEKAIAVGATDYARNRTYYSNYGQQLDLAAPGGVPDADLDLDGNIDGVLQQTFGGGDPSAFSYYYFSGTSMAAPHVAGVAALLISHGNVTNPDQVRQALQNTAIDLGAAGWDEFTGYGLVQAYDALRYQPAPTGTATPLPTATPGASASATSTPTPALWVSTTPFSTPAPWESTTPSPTPTSTPPSIPTSTPTFANTPPVSPTSHSTVTITPIPETSPTATPTPEQLHKIFVPVARPGNNRSQ